VHRDRLAALVALGEVVALEHPRDRVQGREPDQARGAKLGHPAGIEVDLGPLRVQDLVDLGLVGTRVGLDLLAGQPGAGRVLAGRVADHPREIPDQERHVVPEQLELAHLVDQHRMPQVQVGRGRVEAGLDVERLATGEFAGQVRLEQDLVGPAPEFDQLFGRVQHESLPHHA
jgi:hypothetical protein